MSTKQVPVVRQFQAQVGWKYSVYGTQRYAATVPTAVYVLDT